MPCLLDSHESWEQGISLTLSWKKQMMSSGCQRSVGRIYPASLSCPPVSFFLKILSKPHLSLSIMCLPHSLLSLCLPWWSGKGDPEHKVSSVPRMWTRQCSLILKLVNIDQWHLHCTYTHPIFLLSANWTRRTTTGIHADTDDVHPSGRFRGSSQDTKIKDDMLACLRSEPGWSKWPEQLMGTAGTAPAQQLAVAALQTCSINVTERNAYLCQSLSITPSWAQRMKN